MKHLYQLAIMAALFLSTLLPSFAQNCSNVFEPNDSIGIAGAIGLNNGYLGEISNNRDRDFYKLDIPFTGNLQLTLTQLMTDFDLALYNSAGTLIASSAAGGNSSETINYTITIPGKYYAQVYGYNGAHYGSCYLLTNTVTFNCTAAYEPNDDLRTVPPIPLNGSIQAAIDTDTDFDGYSFSFSSIGLFTVNLTDMPADYGIGGFWNETGSNLTASRTWGTSEKITINIAKAGTYRIGILSDRGKSPNCYTLSNTFEPGKCNDIYESNENRESAKKIPINEPIAAQIAASGDEDWFTINTTSDRPNLQITLTNLVVDFDIYLYNNAGVLLGYSVNYGSKNETFNYNGGAAGTYYVRVFGYAGAFNNQCYVLSTTTKNSPFARMAVSDFSSVEEKEAGIRTPGISYYPNPALSGQELQVKLNTGEDVEDYSIRIMDLNGRIISEQVLQLKSGEATLNLANIEPGIYMLDAGSLGVRKLIVQ